MNLITSELTCFNLFDYSIDRRTRAGKMLVRKIRSMDKNRMKAMARNLGDIAPELIMLRIKDYQNFIFKFDLN